MNPTVIEGETDLLAMAQQLQATQEEISRLNAQILRRTGYAAKSIAVQKITDKVALPKDYVADKLWVEVSDEQAEVSTASRGTLMSRYEHTPVPGRGFNVKLHTGKGAVHFRHVFKIPLRGGNGFGLAERVGKKRYPIQVLHAASPSQMMASEMSAIETEVSAVLEKEIATALDALGATEDTSA